MSEVEHAVKVLQIDNNLQLEVKKLEAEGWELVPGIVPVAVYHLVRVKNKPQFAQVAEGIMGVDDSKVHIIRGGKVISH